MTVSVSDAWITPTDGTPNGVMTISAASERLAVLCYTAEHNGQLTENFSIGGVAPTGEHLEFWDNGTIDQHVYFWWWNESAIGAFSDNDIDGTFGGDTPNKHNWSFAVYAGVAQANPVTSAGGNTDTNVLNVSSASTSSDYDVIAVSRSSGSRDVTDWDSLTQQWSDADDGYWTGLAHSLGGDATITITGDGIADDITHAHLIINSAGAGVAPQAMYHYRNHGRI